MSHSDKIEPSKMSLSIVFKLLFFTAAVTFSVCLVTGTGHVETPTVPAIVNRYVEEINDQLPGINRRINRLICNAEGRINRQYNDAESRLQRTVRTASGPNGGGSDAIARLEYETIPSSINDVNAAVYSAQQSINENVRDTESDVGSIIKKGERKALAAIPVTGPVLTDRVLGIVAKAEKRVQKLLRKSAKKLNVFIRKGNKVVDANIAKVERRVDRLLPSVGTKVTDDIKEASEEIDDSIAKGQTSVVDEVQQDSDGLKLFVPAMREELKRIGRD